MGYITHHNISIERSGQMDHQDAHEKLVSLLRDRDVIGYAVDENLDGIEMVKWYNEEKDMMAVTEILGNDVIVMVEGDGEESDDHWRSYYKNGKLLTTVGKVWEEVDLDKL